MIYRDLYFKQKLEYIVPTKSLYNENQEVMIDTLSGSKRVKVIVKKKEEQ
jgi:hypothetical protein